MSFHNRKKTDTASIKTETSSRPQNVATRGSVLPSSWSTYGALCDICVDGLAFSMCFCSGIAGVSCERTTRRANVCLIISAAGCFFSLRQFLPGTANVLYETAVMNPCTEVVL